MLSLNPIISGITLFLLGAAILATTLLVLHSFNKIRRGFRKPESNSASQGENRHEEAVLLIRKGGKIAFINEPARQLFGIEKERPNLEKIARRLRPADTFLELCATGGSAGLFLDGQYLEVTSHKTSLNQNNGSMQEELIVISLRKPGLRLPALAKPESNENKAPGAETSETISKENTLAHTFTVIANLNQTITASLDLQDTLLAILESTERLISADRYSLSVWDKEQQHLVPYLLMGVPGTKNRLKMISERFHSGEGLPGNLVKTLTPVRINNLETVHETQNDQSKDSPYKSYIGVPLIAAGELIGTLELHSLEAEGFKQEDLDLLQLLCAPAATALNNALMFTHEQRRANQLSGLASMAQLAGTSQNLEELFAQLTNTIAPLLNLQFLGFLLYDERDRTLKAQNPFYGLQPGVVEWYQAPIHPNTNAEKIWLSGDTLIATDAPEDARIQALKLHHLAQAAGLKHTVLVPLNTSGRTLGYLQAANKGDQTPFNPNDLRYLTIIAGQAAAMIENAMLIEASKRRTRRAETLRRIASLTSSSATLDEILKFSLLDLSRLLEADIGLAFLFDDNYTSLKLHLPSTYGLNPNIAQEFKQIPLDAPEFQSSASSLIRELHFPDLSQHAGEQFIYSHLYRAAEVLSLISVPMRAPGRVLGELILGSRQVDFFSGDDMQTIATATGQIANAIERTSLITQTDDELRQQLEHHMQLVRLNQKLSLSLNVKELLQIIYTEALAASHADCGRILIFNEAPTKDQENDVQLKLFYGDPPDERLNTLETKTISSGESILVDDFGKENSSVEKGTPEQDYILSPHQGVLSALCVPLKIHGKVRGVIELHALKRFHFKKTARESLEALAVQAGIVLDNALNYQGQHELSQKLQRRLKTLMQLQSLSQIAHEERSMQSILKIMAEGVLEATPAESVLVCLFGDVLNEGNQFWAAGEQQEAISEYLASVTNAESLQAILDKANAVEGFYILDFIAEPKSNPNEDTQSAGNSICLMPLFSNRKSTIGYLSLVLSDEINPKNGELLGTLQIIQDQLGWNLQSSMLLSRLKESVLDLQNKAYTALRDVQTHKSEEDEKDFRIQQLEEHIQKLTQSIQAAEAIQTCRDLDQIGDHLSEIFLKILGFEALLWAKPTTGGVQLLKHWGKIGDSIQPELLLGQRNPISQVATSGQMLLVPSTQEAEEWETSPLLNAIPAKGFVCLPVHPPTPEGDKRGDAQVHSIILATNREPLPAIKNETKLLYQLITQITANVIYDIKILESAEEQLKEVNLLLGFSQRLESLEPDHILQNFLDTAIQVVPGAQSALVALWDDKDSSLQPRYSMGFQDPDSLHQMRFRLGEGLPGQIAQSRKPVLLEEVNFTQHYNLSSENMALLRKATGGQFPVCSLGVPMVISTESPRSSTSSTASPLGVLILNNTQETGVFTQEDLDELSALGHQTALILENARLYQAAERRSQQLQALTTTATAITSSLQPEELIQSLLPQLGSILPFDTATLWMREKTRRGQKEEEQLVILDASGFEDNEERIGLSVDIEDSALLNEMLHTASPLWIPDVRQDSRFAMSLENESLEGEAAEETASIFERQSWLGIPIIGSEGILGVIVLEKEETNFYSSDDIQLAMAFASQAAIGLENAQLYQESLKRAAELDQQSRTLTHLNQLSSKLSSTLDISTILDAALHSLTQLVMCDSVTALMPAAKQGTPKPLLRLQLVIEIPKGGSRVKKFFEIPLEENSLFERLYLTGSLFSTDDISQENELKPLQALFRRHKTQSTLMIPLASGTDASSEEERVFHGLLVAHSTKGHHYTAEELEMARAISNQTAIALQNASLFAETRSLTEELEDRVRQRTAELESERQRAETLLRINTELSASLDLDQVLNSTLQALSEFVDAEHITILISRPGEAELVRLASVGYAGSSESKGTRVPFKQDEGLAGWVITQREPVLIDDVPKDDRWIPFEPVEEERDQFKHRSAMGVPLMSGAEALGCLLLFHSEAGHFSPQHLELVQAAANQVAVAVNNAELFRLIRDQAEDLGIMLRNQQIETSRSKAILESVANGVLVTDAQGKITLFNQAAETILGLSRNEVQDKSFEHFTGLFGKAAKQWMETIATWSVEPDSYESGETYAEQFTLEDGKVISVRLAPVSLNNEFLGTVSIFQDITHQVEVDRLKSEFVATVSHELRTPMTSIKGYVEILLMGAAGKLTEQQEHFLKIVRENTERLKILVNDLLDISKIEAGRVSLSIQPMNIEEVIDAALQELQRRIQNSDKTIQLGKQIKRKLPPVSGDPERVRQILENLLDNAYLYNQPGGEIIIKAHSRNGEVQIDVADSGVGIHPNDLPNVFERFYRGSNPLTLGVAGTGLGLSIVKHLVEMQQGKIWAQSEGPGKGSTFSFTLPIYNLEKEKQEH